MLLQRGGMLRTAFTRFGGDFAQALEAKGAPRAALRAVQNRMECEVAANLRQGEIRGAPFSVTSVWKLRQVAENKYFSNRQKAVDLKNQRRKRVIVL